MLCPSLRHLSVASRPAMAVRKLLEFQALQPCAREFHATFTVFDLKQLKELEHITVIKRNIDRRQFDAGDKEGLPKWDLSRLQPQFAECEEIKSADPIVRKMCSLEYANAQSQRRLLEQELVSRVNRFGTDFESIEARIARSTAQIRTMQVHAKSGVQGNHDGRNKSVLLEAANRRSRFLRRLREWDYNKFCWVLEKLNLEYRPLEIKRATTRKELFQILTQKQAMEIRKAKFEKYHAHLKAKQDEFLERKKKELADIDVEEKEILAALSALNEAAGTIRS